MEYLNTFLIIVAFAAVIWILLKKKEPEEKEDDKAMLMLQQQMADLKNQLGEKIDKTTQHSSKMLQDQFMETSRISKDCFNSCSRSRMLLISYWPQYIWKWSDSQNWK